MTGSDDDTSVVPGGKRSESVEMFAVAAKTAAAKA